ncbi:TetR family transcriptional regulator [Actinoplanes sp. LDG1-06]|uniref:TetR family transcriptional regulator n=1 Tax=Paractinoplanes ovalisporus TaxID=2810368 RepID=A0ABS2A4H9_9ACTN|nr:TetR family transcriptional regulator [Actinoplanes ovalisporus]MBM2614136.1 TetR family transcriptional regulator [Actinoplanes ovalisporus]
MPELPTTTRGAATSRRILDAAAEEFAEFGIAGARIDRITAAARTNKAQLYGYFGSKEGLLDAVVDDLRTQGAHAVTFDAGDLPGWAVAMYDESLRRPLFARLMGWMRLEQRRVGLLFDDVDLADKFAAVAREQAAGRLRAGDPADLLTLIVAMADAWSATSRAYAASPDEPAADHDRRRTLLRETVQRAIAP